MVSQLSFSSTNGWSTYSKPSTAGNLVFLSQQINETSITGTNVSVAFSNTGVVTQEAVGNYLRFCDKDGAYYWMLIDSISASRVRFSTDHNCS